MLFENTRRARVRVGRTVLLIACTAIAACKTTEKPKPPPIGSTGSGSVGLILVEMTDRVDLNLPPTPEEKFKDTVKGFAEAGGEIASNGDTSGVSAAAGLAILAAGPVVGAIASPFGADEAHIQNIDRSLREAYESADAAETVRQRLLAELRGNGIPTVWLRHERHIDTDWNHRDAAYFAKLENRGISEALVVEFGHSSITTPRRLNSGLAVGTRLHARLVETASGKVLRTAKASCTESVPLRYSELGAIDAAAVAEGVRTVITRSAERLVAGLLE